MIGADINETRLQTMPSRIRERTTGRDSSSKMRLHFAMSTVAVMLSNGITPSECFGPSSATPHEKTTTRRYFQNTFDGAVKADGGFRATDVKTNFLSTTLLTQEVPTSISTVPTKQAETTTHHIMPKMPTWLSQPDSHLYEEKWNSLRVSMEESFFTYGEINKLEFAILQASSGSRDKMYGAVEFCLILVETMEMGLNSLIAAVFHYCSCVSARERSLLLPPGMASSAWDEVDYDHSGLAEFGDHAVLIAKDAARLKKLEMVAGMVIQTSEKPRRVTPNSEDAQNLKNLLLTETKDWRALAIRSAAALYRLRGLIKNATMRLTPESALVAREALHIYAPLASRLGMHRLKNELEGAAFRILYPRQYAKVNALAREGRSYGGSHFIPAIIEVPGCPLTSVDIGENMRHILADVKYAMTQMLQNDHEFSSLVSEFSVSARIKEPYSMWKKMLKNGCRHMLEVPDAVALRIILDAKKLSHDEPTEITRARERALCYYAQSLCQQRWEPCGDDSRFKDYIESPKRNGYQSLHYTASTRWGGEIWPMEIQIRSGEMHRVAEFGLASHWEYKAEQYASNSIQQPDIKVLDQSTDSYLRSLQEWHWQQHAGAWDGSPASADQIASSEQAQSQIRADLIRERTKRLEPYLEALKEARSDLTRENVFVFISQTAELPEGKVLSLPAGACVLDAVREVERQLDITIPWKQNCSPVACNGAVAAFTTMLQNGDVLEFINNGCDFQ